VPEICGWVFRVAAHGPFTELSKILISLLLKMLSLCWLPHPLEKSLKSIFLKDMLFGGFTIFIP
jgi:hypothetical protein